MIFSIQNGIYNGIEFVLAYDGYINSKLPGGLIYYQQRLSHARQCCWYCINAGDLCFESSTVDPGNRFTVSHHSLFSIAGFWETTNLPMVS